MGALHLLAASYPPLELNNIGFSLYADFRPVVDGWGKRGEVPCQRILSLRKKGGGEGSEAHAKGDVIKASHPNVFDEFPSKIARTLSLEEYEAALDEEFSFNEADLSQLP
jgi:hypothetical protein